MDVQTVREAWEFYKKSILTSSNAKRSTLISDESRWKCHIDSLLGNKRIDTLTKTDYLLLRKNIEDKNLSPQTVRHVLALLRRVLNASVEWEVYHGKKFSNFQKIFPKFDNMRQRFLSRDEAEKLLLLLEPYENWHDMAMLSLNTGLRLGEIYKISISHINFNERLLTVVDTKTRKNRIIPLNNTALSIFSKKISITNKNDYIFKNQSSKIFRRIVEESGLNDGVTDRIHKVVFHTLRHTFASWLIQKGVPLEVISKLLGHSSLQMTMRYAHLDPIKQSMNAVMSIDL